MNIAVRYYSRSGNTRMIADAIAAAAGTTAVSVDQNNSVLEAPVDVLFIGGALYAYGLDNHLKNWLKTLKKGDAGKAVLFSTTWISKHSFDLMKRALEDAGIPVSGDVFYVRGRPDDEQLKDAAVFAQKYLQ